LKIKPKISNLTEKLAQIALGKKIQENKTSRIIKHQRVEAMPKTQAQNE